MRLWYVSIHVKVPCSLWQSQLHAFKVFLENYLTAWKDKVDFHLRLKFDGAHRQVPNNKIKRRVGSAGKGTFRCLFCFSQTEKLFWGTEETAKYPVPKRELSFKNGAMSSMSSSLQSKSESRAAAVGKTTKITKSTLEKITICAKQEIDESLTQTVRPVPEDDLCSPRERKHGTLSRPTRLRRHLKKYEDLSKYVGNLHDHDSARSVLICGESQGTRMYEDASKYSENQHVHGRANWHGWLTWDKSWLAESIVLRGDAWTCWVSEYLDTSS